MSYVGVNKVGVCVCFVCLVRIRLERGTRRTENHAFLC
uniref:Uncharacterized protein n=1 Tax=Rhizophora mucronata TaxID=61149 RepID=A0A2P2KY92_RHIMU